METDVGDAMQKTVYKWSEEIPWEAYIRIYCLEKTLRQLIVDQLSRITNRWWRRRVPDEVRQSAREKKEVEEKRLVHTIDLDLMWYVDFFDYVEIITRDDNWREAFKRIFGNKDDFRVTIKKLLPIRNKIAHMRPLNPREKKNLDALSEDIFTPIWERVYNEKYVRPSKKLVKSGRFHDAEDILRKGYEETEDPYIAFKLATLYEETRRLERSKELLEYAQKYLALPRYKDLVTKHLHEVKHKIELAESKTCPRCGCKVPKEYIYCGNCGYRILIATSSVARS